MLHPFDLPRQVDQAGHVVLAHGLLVYD
jgi:hypothetical protein